jgi:hypothetical protein
MSTNGLSNDVQYPIPDDPMAVLDLMHLERQMNSIKRQLDDATGDASNKFTDSEGALLPGLREKLDSIEANLEDLDERFGRLNPEVIKVTRRIRTSLIDGGASPSAIGYDLASRYAGKRDPSPDERRLWVGLVQKIYDYEVQEGRINAPQLLG